LSRKTPQSDSKARTASAAVFFNENKSIAGFGNPLRAVFTSVRELVENALDAAEKRNVTPKISLHLRKMSILEVSELMDIDSSKLKDKRLDYLEMICKDNGVGVDRELIPQLFGTVLSGTKYGAQQTRGRFGLGSKMVLLYSMSTLDLPIQITSRTEDSKITHRVKLLINLEKNQPIIVSDEEFDENHEEYFQEPGTEIKVSFTGNWAQAKNYVNEYFKQLAIITPYADFDIVLPGDGNDPEILKFARVVDDLPDPPEVVPVHPWGTDVTTFRREINAADKDMTAKDFLVEYFMGVNEAAAQSFFEEVGVSPEKNPSEFTDKEIRRIVHDGFNRALRESKEIKRRRDRVFKFDEPRGDALSPLGADRLRKGMEKELEPEFVEAITRPPKAYEGHPFIIEAAVGYGGGVSNAAASKAVSAFDNKIVYRYANRIPLIFGGGSDVITNVIKDKTKINWTDHGLTSNSAPLAIAVSLVSTKIPFPETSKEYIDRVEEIEDEIKQVLLLLGRKLKTFLNRSRRKDRERQRRSRFEKYAPSTVDNLIEILERANKWSEHSGLQKSRIVSALSSGAPRIGKHHYPMFKPVYSQPAWSNFEIEEKLRSKGIVTVEEFLKTSNKNLVKILNLKEVEVDNVKRRTLQEVGSTGELPEFNHELLVNSDIEKRFHTKDSEFEFQRLNKSFYKRWIRNSWDFLVTPNDLLVKVQGFPEKLVENLRYSIMNELSDSTESESHLVEELNHLLESGGLDFFKEENPDYDIDKEKVDQLLSSLNPDEAMYNLGGEHDEEIIEALTELTESSENSIISDPTPYTKDIDIKYLIPKLEDVLDHPEIKKRKITSHIEFLLEYSHPSNPIDDQTFANVLISSLKDALIEYVANDPQKADITISKDTMGWIDGNTINMMTKSLKTVQDLINTEEEELLKIKGLHRALFNEFVNQVSANKIELAFALEGSEFEAYVSLLSDLGIDHVETLAKTSVKLITNKAKSKPLIDLLLDKGKETILEHLYKSNQVTTLDHLKVITDELAEELFEMNISDMNELIALPLIRFNENIRERIIDAKKRLGTLPVGFNKTETKLLEKLEIYCIEELIYYPKDIFSFELTQTETDTLVKLYQLLIVPPLTLSQELYSVNDFLLDAGINSLGKFLIWPNDEIHIITNLPTEWIGLIKEGFSSSEARQNLNKLTNFSKVEHLFSEKEVEAINTLKIESIEELASLNYSDVYPELESLEIRNSYNELLKTKIINIEPFGSTKKQKTTFTALTKDLDNIGVKTIYQLINSSEPDLIAKINGKVKKDLLETFLSSLKAYDIETINNEDLLNAVQINSCINKLNLSPIHLSEFNNEHINSLGNIGIRTIHQLLSAPPKNIANQISLKESDLLKRIKESRLDDKGTSLIVYDTTKAKLVKKSIITFEFDGLEHFQPKILDALTEAGYSTIESIYYKSNMQTFDVYGLSWDVIKHMKSLLRSPVVVLSWRSLYKSEVETEELEPNTQSDSESNNLDTESILDDDLDDEIIDTKPKGQKAFFETLTSDELRKLSQTKYTRVIDFLTLGTKELAGILGWKEDVTLKKQQSTFLQEVGIELDDLNIFRDYHLKILEEYGLLTVEDLYFSTYEDTWESEEIPYEAIKILKQILELPVKHVIEEIGEEVIGLLQENNIPRIIDFLLTGDPILEQKTGLPAERFENLKHALDFNSLIDCFAKPVFFIPNISYYDAKSLTENNIKTILDFLYADPKQISKITKREKDEIDFIIKTIEKSEIDQNEIEQGVLLKEIKIFNRSDSRLISRSSIFEALDINTVQELMYSINPKVFQGENYLLNRVLEIQKVLKINLDRFSYILPDELEILHEYKINTIEDLIFVYLDDLKQDIQRDSIIQKASRELIDLRPLVALSQLPASAASEEELEGNLLDVWIETPEKLNIEVVQKIQNIMNQPVKFTRVSKIITDLPDEIADSSLADICLTYAPAYDDPINIIKSSISTPGALITLINEGRTPITLLKLEPLAVRSLIQHDITSIEGLTLKDPKFLSSITKMPQKFFKDVIDSFDPDKYQKRLEYEGISVLRLVTQDEDFELLSDVGILYLDQIPSIKSNQYKIVEDLRTFLMGSNIFLNGYPGELEIIQNQHAHTVIESIVALKNLGIDLETLTDIIILGYRTRLLYSIPINIKNNWLNDKNINTIQDLVTYSNMYPKEKLPDSQQKLVNTFITSTLFIDMPGKTLEELVFRHRCARIIDTLTYPLIGNLFDYLREEAKNGVLPILENEIRLPHLILQGISSTQFRRLPEGIDLSIQDLISSPRLLEEYKSIKKNVLDSIRSELNIPLTRLIVNGKQMNFPKNIMTFDLLVCYLPELLKQDPNYTKRLIKDFSIDIKVIPEIEYQDHNKDLISTAFGQQVFGFHEMWAKSNINNEALQKAGSDFANLVIKIIKRSFYSLSAVDDITYDEVWQLWQNDVYTVADLLLSSNHVLENNIISKKRYKELLEICLKFTVKTKERDRLTLFEVFTALDLPLDNLEVQEIVLLYSMRIHPLVHTKTSFSDIHYILSQPIILTEFINNLNLEHIKKILSLGIKTLADFLIYVEDSKLLPDFIRYQKQRLQLISTGPKVVRKDLEIQDLNLPEDDFKQISSKKLVFLSDLIGYYSLPENTKDKTIFTSSLRYTDLPKDYIDKLKSVKVETILDFIISPAALICDALNIEDYTWHSEQYTSFDFHEIKKRSQKAFLPFTSISELSKKCVDTLQNMNYFSLFDVPKDLPTDLSRNDSKIINQLRLISKAPVQLLCSLSDFTDEFYEDIKDLINISIAELITEYELSTKFDEFIFNQRSTNWLDLPNLTRKLNIIESIRNSEVKKLHDAGIFTFSQIVKTGKERLEAIDIEGSRVDAILDELNLPVNNIIELDDKIIQESQKHDIEFVYQFFDSYHFKQVEFDGIVTIKKPVSIVNLFDEKLSEYLKNYNIENISQLLSSPNILTDFKNNNKEIQQVINLLHTDIEGIKEINNRWINNLHESKITKIWQFLNENEEKISTILGVSPKSIVDLKLKIKLPNELLNRKVDPIVNSMKEFNDFIELGFQSLRDFDRDIILIDLINQNKDLSSLFLQFEDLLDHSIWKAFAYWEMPLDFRIDLANQGAEKFKFLHATGNKFIDTEIINLINTITNDQQPWKESEDLLSIISDTKISSFLKKHEFHSIEMWLFKYYNKKYLDQYPIELRNYFRSPITNIEGLTLKQIIKANENGYSHVSDVFIKGLTKFSSDIGLKDNVKIEKINLKTSDPSLYPVGLVSKNIIGNIDQKSYHSWLQLIGNIIPNDFEGMKGVTEKSFNSIKELLSTPVYKLPVVRDLGIEPLNNLIANNICTVKELLIAPKSSLADIIKYDGLDLDNLFENITKADINKLEKQPQTPLNFSKKIKVADVKILNQTGINDIEQLILNNYNFSIPENLSGGIEDITNNMLSPINNLDIPEKHIEELNQLGIQNIGELLILTDQKLKSETSLTPILLKDIRTKIPIKKAVSSKTKTSASKEPKKSKPTQKQEVEKKSEQSKPTAKKKIMKKKVSKKSSTSSSKSAQIEKMEKDTNEAKPTKKPSKSTSNKKSKSTASKKQTVNEASKSATKSKKKTKKKTTRRSN
jgi:DNA topoisomerase VI subunit B